MSFSEWHRVSIKDVFELIPGFAFKSKDFSENGIPVIKIKNVKALRLLDRDFSYIDPKYLETKSRFTTKKGDLLISMTGNRIEGSMSSWVGKVCRINSDKKYLINQRVGILRLSNESYSDKFFLYLLGSEEIQKKLISIATSSGGQANISPDQIKSLEFSIPCFEEQNAIAHILSTLDEKIEVNNRINKTLENMAQAIFKQWFVDFEFPNEDGEPYKSSGGEMVESELGLIPKGWKVSTVGELTAIVSKGTTPRKSDIDSATDNNCVKFLKVKDISDHGVIDLTGLEMIPSSIHLNQLKRSVLKYKDVLISIAGTIGRVSYVNEELVNANTNQAVAFIRLKDVEKHFLLMHYKFKSSDFQDSIRSKIVQGVQANISLSVIKDEKLILPDDNVLGLYNNVLNNIFNESNILYKEINSLTNIRDSLLPKLMSGEIRVPLDEEGDAS